MKRLSKVVSCIVIGGTLLSAGSIAFADTKDSTAVNNGLGNRPALENRVIKGRPGAFGKYMTANFKEEFKSLVSAGVISEDEYAKLQELSDKKAEERKAELEKIKNMTEEERKTYFQNMKSETPKNKVSIFDEAVEQGILTQEKADAAQGKLQEIRQAEMKNKVTESLNSLVEKGTITQKQMDKIVEAINNEAQTRKTEFENIKNMAEGQRKEYFDQKKADKSSPLSGLVDNGTLTKEQLQEIKKVLSMGI